MNGVRETLGGIARTVTQSSKDMIKTTKLSMDLSGEENALKNIYLDIGKKVREVYSYGGSLGEFFDGKYAEIVRAEARIADIKGRINLAKGRKNCPKCGFAADKEAEFCPKCGSGFAEATRAPQPEAPEKKIEGKICPICGENNGPAEKFCLVCGRML